MEKSDKEFEEYRSQPWYRMMFWPKKESKLERVVRTMWIVGVLMIIPNFFLSSWELTALQWALFIPMPVVAWLRARKAGKELKQALKDLEESLRKAELDHRIRYILLQTLAGFIPKERWPKEYTEFLHREDVDNLAKIFNDKDRKDMENLFKNKGEK